MISALSRYEFIQAASQPVWKASGTFLMPCLWFGVLLHCHNDLIVHLGQKSSRGGPEDLRNNLVFWALFKGRGLRASLPTFFCQKKCYGSGGAQLLF